MTAVILPRQDTSAESWFNLLSGYWRYFYLAAAEIVRKGNGVLGVGLGAATIMAAKKKHWAWTGIFGMFALTAFGIAVGLIKEQE